MATQSSGLNQLPRFYDALMGFIHQLRADGFSIGMGQYLYVQELLVKLAAAGQMPENPKELQSFIAPVLCQTPAEQAEFDDRFARWVRPFSPQKTVRVSPSETQDDIPVPEKIQSKVKTVHRREQYWKQFFMICGVSIAVFMGLMLIYAAWKTIFQYGVYAGLFLLIMVIIRWLWLHHEARLFLSRRSESEKVMTRHLFVKKPSDAPFVTTRFMQTSQEFRRHRTIASGQLDVKASIEKSIQHGGWFMPVKGTRKVSPEYLALIERNTARDHQAQFANALMDIMRNQGVYITHFYYDTIPVHCYPENDHSKRIHLMELISKYPDHRLMIFSSGEEMIDPFTDQKQSWIDMFDAWKNKALLTFSDEIARYGNNHPLFDSNFMVIPATDEGFRLFIESIQSEKKQDQQTIPMDKMPERFREDIHELLNEHEPHDIDSILSDVRRFVGPSGYEWFAACAIYPAVQWHLTLYLGINLTENGQQHALFHIKTLSALSQLPWFRHGSMPNWLRERLIQDMSMEQERNIRQVIYQLLLNASHEPLRSFKLTLAEYEKRFFARFAGKIVQKLTQNQVQKSMQDVIFLTFMADPLSVRVPKLLRQYLKPVKPEQRSTQQPIQSTDQKTAPETDEKGRPKHPKPGDTWTETITGMEFVWVPGGRFMMGSPEDEKERFKHEGPMHEVYVDGFWMGKFPVTQKEWELIMGKNPSAFKSGDRFPVENVSWDDCQAYIQQLNTHSKHTFRLPTEAEWEYACRAGTTTPFYFGKTISTDQANYDGNYPYADSKKGIYRKKTTPVDQFKPNAFGLYDMHGNVWEWCDDVYAEKAYQKHAERNPVIQDGGSDRVLRGGSWINFARILRSANRYRNNPGFRYSNTGFRLLEK
jgi:formylglycine-generating enzyme required for sulfatase activity